MAGRLELDACFPSPHERQRVVGSEASRLALEVGAEGAGVGGRSYREKKPPDPSPPLRFAPREEGRR